MANVLVCAHRGASASAPENTLAALRLAIDQGADMAEIDVQLSADGHPVLFHDDRLGRTAPGTAGIGALTLRALRALDAGSWFSPAFAGERIPTLAEVLDEVGARLPLNIELKIGGDDAQASRRLAQAVIGESRGRDLAMGGALTSFDHAVIDHIASGEGGRRYGYIVGDEAALARLWDGPAPILSVRKELITPEVMAHAHAAGKEIHAWTANTEAELRRLAALGVRAVISDDPASARRWLEAMDD